MGQESSWEAIQVTQQGGGNGHGESGWILDICKSNMGIINSLFCKVLLLTDI